MPGLARQKCDFTIQPAQIYNTRVRELHYTLFFAVVRVYITEIWPSLQALDRRRGQSIIRAKLREQLTALWLIALLRPNQPYMLPPSPIRQSGILTVYVHLVHVPRSNTSEEEEGNEGTRLNRSQSIPDVRLHITGPTGNT